MPPFTLTAPEVELEHELTIARSEAQRLRVALAEIQTHAAALYARAAREQNNTLARGLDLLASIAEETLEQ